MTDVDVESLYQKFGELGLQYGPRFQTIKKLKTDKNHALVELEVKDAEPFSLHPALLDGAFQAMLTLGEEDSRTAYLPVHVNEIRFHGSVDKRCTAYVSLLSRTDKSVTADIKFLSNNKLVVELNGIRCDAAQLHSGNDAQQLEELTYKPVWHQLDHNDSLSAVENVIIIGEQVPQGLKDELLGRGCHNISEFRQLSQFVQASDRTACQLLIMCVNSDSAQQAINQAGQALVNLVKLEDRIAGANCVFLTHSAQAGEIRGRSEGWNSGWVAGLRRNLTNELRRLQLRQVDYDDAVSPQNLCDELLSSESPDEIALVADKRYALEICRFRSDEYKQLMETSLTDFIDRGDNNFYLELPDNGFSGAPGFKETCPGNSRAQSG